jgi:hypothetical protein
MGSPNTAQFRLALVFNDVELNLLKCFRKFRPHLVRNLSRADVEVERELNQVVLPPKFGKSAKSGRRDSRMMDRQNLQSGQTC